MAGWPAGCVVMACVVVRMIVDRMTMTTSTCPSTSSTMTTTMIQRTARPRQSLVNESVVLVHVQTPTLPHPHPLHRPHLAGAVGRGPGNRRYPQTMGCNHRCWPASSCLLTLVAPCSKWQRALCYIIAFIVSRYLVFDVAVGGPELQNHSNIQKRHVVYTVLFISNKPISSMVATTTTSVRFIND